MQTYYDYKRFYILYVDDEERSLKQFARVMEEHFKVLTATNAADGYRLLEEYRDEIGVLMTDQRMPGEKGVQLLEKARQLRPRIIRILATAYSDIDAAVDAVNTGAIYKYVSKPWEVEQLVQSLRRAMEFFVVQRERDQLLREKMAVLHNMMITDRVVSLGVLAAGLSHHIRNSLVAVRTFLDLAPAKLGEERVDLEQLRNPNYWCDFYEQVQTQVKRITDMLSELGTASAVVGTLFQDQVQLSAVMSVALARVAPELSKKRIQIENLIPENLPSMAVDQAKFYRLFELLIKDEAVSLPEGAAITLKARLLPATLAGEPEIEVEISDNGPGLPQEALRSLFDPFFIRADQPQEFGINLMAAYFITYHHGGRIQVKSGPLGGTIFLLTFATQPRVNVGPDGEHEFLEKVLMNETLWERLLAGT
jgi:two-component system probable response regulator PhcQ